MGTYLVVRTKISGPQLFEGKSALQIFPSLQKVFPWFVPSRYVCRCNTKFCVSYGDFVYFKQFCLVKICFTQYISHSLWVHCVFQTVWLVKTRFTQYISHNLWRHIIYSLVVLDVAILITTKTNWMIPGLMICSCSYLHYFWSFLYGFLHVKYSAILRIFLIEFIFSWIWNFY